MERKTNIWKDLLAERQTEEKTEMVRETDGQKDKAASTQT